MEEGKKTKYNLVWQDFLDYLTRRFTNHEMHHFERSVDKSAFDTEALEGLEQFAGASMDNDIELLKEHIHKRNTLFKPEPQRKFPIRSIAAVAIIVVVSGIVISIFVNKKDNKQQLAQNEILSTQSSSVENQQIRPNDTFNVVVENEMVESSAEVPAKKSNIDTSRISKTQVATTQFTIAPSDSGTEKQNIRQSSVVLTNKLHPEQGDSVFSAQLKTWLATQNLENEGKLKIKLIFDSSNKAGTVSVLVGINEETNKAIQFYIMNKTRWFNHEQKPVKSGEFTYFFTL